jgi:hypothetical protein
MPRREADPTHRPTTPAPAGGPSAGGGSGGAVDLPFTTPIPVEKLLTPAEAVLVRRLAAFARGGAGPFQDDLWRALDTGLTGLGNIAEAIASYPSLRETRTLGGKERSLNTLVDTLVRGGEHALEWNLPTKSILSRSFGIAKVNFFMSLRYVVEACQADEVPSLLEGIAAAIEEAVYTRLAEELLASFLPTQDADRDLKRLAVLRLVELWEGRLALTMDTLAPILRSVWQARTRAVRVFGTMMGTAEIMQMLFANCSHDFVAWFARREVTPEQQQAFEEFLFDIPFESLQRVRYRMMEDGLAVVDRAKVEEYLGLTPGALRPMVGDPKDLYVAFRRRRVRAQYRAATNAPGPRRTAEGYLMEAILRHQLPDGVAPTTL